MTERPEYPRVLVVGQSFNRVDGGGITISDLFEGWPRDRLAAVIAPSYPMEFDVCDRYYVLGRSEIAWRWPLSLVTRSETPPSRPDAAAVPATLVSGRAPGETRPQPIAERLFRAGVDWLGVGQELRSMRLSNQLRDWIRELEPDLVYSQLSHLPIMMLVRQILDESNLPFVLHMMDDWPSSMWRQGALAWAVRGHGQQALKSLLRRTQARMAIGDAMAEEYLRRYGMQFVPIQKSVDIDQRDALAALHRREYEGQHGASLLLVYSGRLGVAVAQSLLTVAEVVAEMVAGGAQIELRVYTHESNHPIVGRMSALDGVEVRSAVPYDHVPALLASADILVIPIDFDDESVRFIQFSMPTKIPDYMASGRPVLVYAPRGSAAAEYARHGGWASLVDEPNPGLIREALAALADDGAVRDAMGARARRLVVEKHDTAVVRARFVEELVGAAGMVDKE